MPRISASARSNAKTDASKTFFILVTALPNVGSPTTSAGTTDAGGVTTSITAGLAAEIGLARESGNNDVTSSIVRAMGAITSVVKIDTTFVINAGGRFAITAAASASNGMSFNIDINLASSVSVRINAAVPYSCDE